MESQREWGPWGAKGEYEGGNAPGRGQAGPGGARKEVRFVLRRYKT
jgi:hypothetical protein